MITYLTTEAVSLSHQFLKFNQQITERHTHQYHFTENLDEIFEHNSMIRGRKQMFGFQQLAFHGRFVSLRRREFRQAPNECHRLQSKLVYYNFFYYQIRKS